MRISDWSSDVCSSDLGLLNLGGESSCEQMQRLVERQLADVRLRLGELRQLECDLAQMRVQCSHVPAGERCPTLDLLEHAGAGVASGESSRSVEGYSARRQSDSTRVVEGKRVSVRKDAGGSR